MIRIKFVGEKRWFAALRNVRRAIIIQSKTLPMVQAVDFSNLIIFNINNQRTFMRGYSRFHPKYATWKQLNVPIKATKFWDLHGDLVRAVQPYKIGGASWSFQTTGGSAWMAGIPPGVHDTGGKSWLGGVQPTGAVRPPRGDKKQIAMYAAINERLRPLFGPTEREYAKSSDRIAHHVRAGISIMRRWV